MANFTIDPEDLIKQRLSDRLSIIEGLPRQGAALEAANPQVTAMPNASAEAQGIATPEQVNYTMNQLQQRFPTPQAPTPPSPSEIGQEIATNPEQSMIQMGLHPVVAKELAKHITDSGPPKLIGKDIFGENRGGIFGTGVSPIDVLALGLGAVITRRLPQDQAIAATMKIAGLPSEFKAAQRKAGGEVIAQLLSAGNLAHSQGTLQVQQAELQAKTTKQNALNAWTAKWGARLANGVPPTGIEQQQMATEAISAGIPHDSIKQFMVKPLTEQLAELEIVKQQFGPNVRVDLTSPTGAKYRVGGSSSEKAINPTELKVFADTGIRGGTIPEGMDRPTAKMAVKAEQTRQIQLTGGKARATAENTPLPPQAQDKIASIEDFDRTLGRLINNFKNEYAGARGWTYGLARTELPLIGSVPGVKKPTGAEQNWYSDHANATSILVNVRSGQQSAEPEFKRLQGIIGNTTDKPDLLLSSLKNLKKQTETILSERKKLATQPKMEIYRGGSVPEGAKKVED